MKKRGKRQVVLSLGLMIAVTLLMLCVPTQAYADETNEYSVSYSLTHASVNNQISTAVEGSKLSVQLKPASGYSLPSENVSVYVNGSKMTNGFSYSESSGSLSVSEVYGNLVISATGTKGGTSSSSSSTEKPSTSTTSKVDSSCSVSYDVDHVLKSKNDGSVSKGSSYSVSLKAKPGYTLRKADITLYSNGDVVRSGYSYSGGVLRIDKITGDTVISAIAVKKASSNNRKKVNSSSGTGKSKSAGTTHSKSSQNYSSPSGKGTSTYRTVSSGNKTVRYTPPKTGDTKMNKWYFMGFGLLLLGAAMMIMPKRKKE